MLEGIQSVFIDNVLYAPFWSLDFPVGIHMHKNKTGKHDKLIAWQQIYLLLASCNHVKVILMRKHMHQTHLAFCIITCWSLHAFPLASYCFPQHLHPDEDIQDTDCSTVSDLRSPFSLGVQAHLQQCHALTALLPACPGAVTSIAFARSTCVCIFVAKTLPSMGHFHSWLTIRVCWSGVINGQCVSPADCWIHTQGKTPLGCQAFSCTPGKILRGYSKRITVICFSFPKKPSSSSSLILQRSDIK